MTGIRAYEKHLHALRARGYSLQEIAHEVGYSYPTVVRFFSLNQKHAVEGGAELQRLFESAVRKRLSRRRN